VLEAARLTLKDLGKVPATDVTSLPLVLRFYFLDKFMKMFLVDCWPAKRVSKIKARYFQEN